MYSITNTMENQGISAILAAMLDEIETEHEFRRAIAEELEGSRA